MKARLTVNRLFVIGEAEKELWGGFIEQMGRAIYTGIYEPEHPLADEQGFRKDVIELIKELDMPLTRYPGGNFVSGYNWKDGIGPVEERPVRAEYAWKALEPNKVGIHEFIDWCRKANTEPIYAVNLGTDTPKSAQEIVEYCNMEGGTYWSELRKKNGAEAPFNIRYWCLGNEADGEWQIGHMTAGEYGRKAHETAKMMRMVDKNIKLTICGTSHISLPTYGKWDYEVMRHVFDEVDFLSIHLYFGNNTKDYKRFFAHAELLDINIENAIACCDCVAAERKSLKKVMISLDEWNVGYRCSEETIKTPPWNIGRDVNEEIYDMADVITDGCAMLSMLDHADRLKIGCLAQSVNVIAPVMTRAGGGSWRQTIFYPFRETSRYGRGTVLRGVLDSPSYEEPSFFSCKVNYLRSTAVWRKEAGEVTVFAINRAAETMEFEAVLENFVPEGIAGAVEIHHESLEAINTEYDEQVCTRDIAPARYSLEGNMLKAELKPYSWNMFRIKVGQ